MVGTKKDIYCWKIAQTFPGQEEEAMGILVNSDQYRENSSFRSLFRGQVVEYARSVNTGTPRSLNSLRVELCSEKNLKAGINSQDRTCGRRLVPKKGLVALENQEI